MADDIKNIQTHYIPKGGLTVAKEHRSRKYYEELGGWFADTSLGRTYIIIYAPSKKKEKGIGYIMGNLQSIVYPDGHKEEMLYIVKPNYGGYESLPWDFNKVDAAVRYVWLKTQIPREQQLQEEKQIRSLVRKILFEQDKPERVDIPGLEGWYAERITDPAAMPGWLIRKKAQSYGFRPLGQIYDNGYLRIGSHIEGIFETGRTDLANDPIKAARYIWLKRQQPISEQITESKIQDGLNEYNIEVGY